MNIKLKHALLELCFELDSLVLKGKDYSSEKIDNLMEDKILFETLLKEHSLNIAGITFKFWQENIGLDDLVLEIEECLYTEIATEFDNAGSGLRIVVSRINQYIRYMKY